MLKALSRSLVSAVFPLSCEICESSLPLGVPGALCGRCRTTLVGERSSCIRCGRRSNLERNGCMRCLDERYHFDSVTAAAAYEGGVKKLLCAFKFKRRRAALDSLSGLLSDLVRKADAAWDGAVAVPMPPPLERERGFNQAELLASCVAQTAGIPFLKRHLSVGGEVQQQAKLGRKERERNVRGLFVSKPCAGKKLVLVDDVLTTGQTASECARALKSAGAVSVDVLVLARAE